MRKYALEPMLCWYCSLTIDALFQNESRESSGTDDHVPPAHAPGITGGSPGLRYGVMLAHRPLGELGMKYGTGLTPFGFSPKNVPLGQVVKSDQNSGTDP